MNAPMLHATGLWQKTSAKGDTYFVGRLGGMKVLVLPNTRRQGENDPTHNLVFTEAQQPQQQDRRQLNPERTQPEARETSRSQRRSYAAATKAQRPHNAPAGDPGPAFNDDLPF